MSKPVARTISRIARSASRASFALAGLMALAACATTSPTSTSIALGPRVDAPTGLQVFCVATPEACGERSSRSQLEQTDGSISTPATGGGANAPDMTDIKIAAPAGVYSKSILAGAAPATVEPDILAEARTVQPARNDAKRLEATPELFAQLARVNRVINGRIRWVPDEENYGLSEYWVMPLRENRAPVGDCEDFALEKRAMLLEAGLPQEALALATAHSNATGMHAVLIVRTSAGDFVLDNTSPWVRGWDQTGYTWLTMQASADVLDWRRIS